MIDNYTSYETIINVQKLCRSNHQVANNHQVGRCLGSNPQVLSHIMLANIE